MGEGGRLGIIAGDGRLPVHLARSARNSGHDPLIISLHEDADQDWSGFDCHSISIADFKSASQLFARYGVDRVVMSGGIGRRPDWSELRPTWRLLRRMPGYIRTLIGAGDDKLLRTVISIVEGEGVKVISVQDIAPDLLATVGPIGKHIPSKTDLRDIQAASRAALALGKLDIGQGAVAVGGRVIALEGLEGTDAMLERVEALRASGRLTRRHPGVLVKMCKPSQDVRADLPSTGPITIRLAKAAGLAGIAQEVGRSLILDREKMVKMADQEGLFIVGIEPMEDPS